MAANSASFVIGHKEVVYLRVKAAQRMEDEGALGPN